MASPQNSYSHLLNTKQTNKKEGLYNKYFSCKWIHLHLKISRLTYVGRVAQSVQRLATGWTVRGSNPGGGEIFRTCLDRPWGPPSLLYKGTGSFPGGKERPGRNADPSPPSSALVMKEQSYTSTRPMGCTACTEPQCLHKGALYFYLTGWPTHTRQGLPLYMMC